MKNLLWILITLGVMFALNANAELYRWVDKNGVTQYSDRPPPADARDIQQKRLIDSKIESDKVPFAVRTAMANNPVILYSSDCGSTCDSARALLTKRGIPFTTRDPGADPRNAEALKKLIGGNDIPTLAVGDQYVRGFADVLWQAALDAGGYPRVIQNRGQTTAVTPTSPVPAPATPPQISR